MDIKKEIELVATKVIFGFDPKKHMNRNLFDDFGMDSLDQLELIARVEDACLISIPVQLNGKLKSVSDLVVVVENFKKVKKTNSTWVPCRLNNTRQCRFMSNEAENARLRSDISPNTDFCNVMACSLYRGECRQR